MQKQLDNRWSIGHRLLLAIVVMVSFAGGSVLIGHAETAPSDEAVSSTSNAVTSSQVGQSATSAVINGDSAVGVDTVSSIANTATAPAVDTTSTKTSTARSVATQQPKAVATTKAAKTATVKVIYMMDTGGILGRDTLTGRVGQRYTATAAEFQDSRDFQLKGPKTVTGTFGKGATTIRFVYQVPRVIIRNQQGLDVVTVRYADGGLKYIDIYDDLFDFMLTKNVNGQSEVVVRIAQPMYAGKVTVLAPNTVKTMKNRVGYFKTQTADFIFEKVGRVVKVMRVDRQSGKVTAVQTVPVRGTSANAVASQLGISQTATFTRFWQQLVADTSQVAKADGSHTTAGFTTAGNAPTTGATANSRATRLPQTGEQRTSLPVYGYALLILSVLGLVKRRRQD
ncbi:MucBP domain-containing protein [Levilactobacillus brevis]|uniref:MucBP domain-containing protein n=1 Tax=Levilactobacillus brevis TaxID=1580 RepID=UPI0021A91E33|nr:MucBP domain-containing protein [Levilactobacillus brevis]MCT3573969.1 LPXTG cell wall anchor domain-containing protein [Levilactobacillus brevis]